MTKKHKLNLINLPELEEPDESFRQTVAQLFKREFGEGILNDKKQPVQL